MQSSLKSFSQKASMRFIGCNLHIAFPLLPGKTPSSRLFSTSVLSSGIQIRLEEPSSAADLLSTLYYDPDLNLRAATASFFSVIDYEATWLRTAEISTIFLGSELMPSFESIWQGMPHSKHSNTIYWGVAAADSRLFCVAVPLREKPEADLPVVDFDG